jgi:D-alanyl-D-alanine carboxypeptidase
MNPRRSATLAAAFYPAAVIAGWAFANLAGIGSPHIATSAAAHVVDRLAPSLTANANFTAAPQTTTMGYAAPGSAEVATAAAFIAKPVTETTAAPAEQQPIVVAALTEPSEILSPETPPAPAPPANSADAQPRGAATTAGRIEIIGECLVAEPCIDQYLFALYERTPKEDTIKETEKRQVSVKRKGKLVTVTRNFSKQVENDFTWKDPKAAERTGMSMSDYVIGGMDRSFKLRLFRMLQAAENAGLQPGITSAFRDDYRQSIAAGLKAASNRSYHGGSLRGGYGHGLAADIVSVNGTNRAERWTSTEAFWKWVDANGKQFGIGRPYLGHDPPHVGPIDGPEYVSRRGGTKAADVKKRDRQATTQGKPDAIKRAVAARSSSSSNRLAEAR